MPDRPLTPDEQAFVNASRRCHHVWSDIQRHGTRYRFCLFCRRGLYQGEPGWFEDGELIPDQVAMLREYAVASLPPPRRPGRLPLGVVALMLAINLAGLLAILAVAFR